MSQAHKSGNTGRATIAALAIFLLLLLSCGGGSPTISSKPPVDSEPTVAIEAIAISDDGSQDPGSPGQPGDFKDGSPLNKVILLPNQGGRMEGNTPRGFSGMGVGLFAGENLNPSFPNGDEVQLFLTFDLNAVPSGKVVSALLSSEHASVRGMPLKDLGPLRAEEERYSEFSRSPLGLYEI